MDTWQAPVIGAIFLLAGGVKGITGMGLPTVAVSLLSFWMAPAQAAALLVMPSLVTNIAQCRGPNGWWLLAKLWPAWLALAVVTVWAPEMGDGAALISTRALLGSVLVIYGLWGLWRPVLPDLSLLPRWVGAIVGAATGVITAGTAVFVMPLVPYLQALRLERAALVQALGLSFTVATLALAIRLQTSQGVTPLPPLAALALAAALVGQWLGTWARDRIGAVVFQRSLFVVFIALGSATLLRGG